MHGQESYQTLGFWFLINFNNINQLQRSESHI